MKRVVLIITILGFLITNVSFADKTNFMHYCSIAEEITREISQLSYDLANGSINESSFLRTLQQLKTNFNERSRGLVDEELIRAHQFLNKHIDLTIEQVILTNKYKTKSIVFIEWWLRNRLLQYKLEKIKHNIIKEMKQLRR